jgi:hypothetical protein
VSVQRGPSGLPLPVELLQSLCQRLEFPSLVTLAGVSIFHRSFLHAEIVRRLRLLIGLPAEDFPPDVLYSFFDALDRAKALIAGGVARGLVCDDLQRRHMDILCPTQTIDIVEEGLIALGYVYNGLDAAVYPCMTDAVHEVRIFERRVRVAYISTFAWLT